VGGGQMPRRGATRSRGASLAALGLLLSLVACEPQAPSATPAVLPASPSVTPAPSSTAAPTPTAAPSPATSPSPAASLPPAVGASMINRLDARFVPAQNPWATHGQVLWAAGPRF